MKKILIGLALCGTLASCGGGVSNSGDSGAFLQFDKIATSYQDASDPTQPYGSVACDVAYGPGNATTSKTQVAVYFTAAGTVSSVRIQLLGKSNSQFDGNFDTTVSGSQLQSLGGNQFKYVFDADSGTNPLPLAIIPTPTQTTVKVVNTPNAYLGDFYAKLTITDGNGNFGSVQSPSIHVYDTCDVTSDTGQTL